VLTGTRHEVPFEKDIIKEFRKPPFLFFFFALIYERMFYLKIRSKCAIGWSNGVIEKGKQGGRP